MALPAYKKYEYIIWLSFDIFAELCIKSLVTCDDLSFNLTDMLIKAKYQRNIF